MTEPNAEQLLRASRRWRRIALVALTALVLAVAGWSATAVVQWRQMRAAQEQAEKAKEDADRARDAERQARERAEQALYASQIHLAEKAFADGLQKAEKP
jgi:hypothetical protein